MINAAQRRDSSAFTLMEIIVIIATMAVLMMVVISIVPRRRQQARRLACVSNLKQLGTAFRMWANDSAGGYPVTKLPFTNEVSFYMTADADQMSSPKILICPDDTRTASTTFSNLKNDSISYFLGMDADDTYPGFLLSGDRNITMIPTPQTNLWELGTNKNVGWSELLHNKKGNIGLSDGSVQQVEEKKLRVLLESTGDATNRILLPF